MLSYLKVAAVAVVLVLAGCSSVPILNVSDAAITTASGKAMSNAEVRSSILRAGAALGWQM